MGATRFPCNSLVGHRAAKSVLHPISEHDEEALHEFNFLRTDASTTSARAALEQPRQTQHSHDAGYSWMGATEVELCVDS